MRAGLALVGVLRRRLEKSHPAFLVFGLLALLLAASSQPASATHEPGAGQQSLWPDTATPAGFGRDDLGGDTLGVRFQAARSGTVDGLEYYRPPNDTATHTLTLWTDSGTKLASATVTTSVEGWEHALFSAPVPITGGTIYVASVHSPDGYYSQTAPYFSSPYTNGDLTALQDTSSTPNGVYAYGAETFPTQTWNSSNYWVDVLFTPDTTTDDGSEDSVEALGAWETLAYDTEFTLIHAAVLRTGKVFLMAGSENIPTNLANGRLYGGIWDVSTGTMTPIRPPYDMFCSAHAFLPDGKLLIAGGTEAYPTDDYSPTSGTYYLGSKAANLFDPVSQAFEPVPDMAAGRWYPTLVGLGNGDVFAMSGLDGESKVNVVPEIYTRSETGGSWRTTPSVSATWPLYPHLTLLRGGKLFYSGGSVDNYNVGVLDPGLLEPETSGFTPVGGLSYRDRREAATVLLPPAQAQRALIIGGGDPAVNNVDIIDLSAPSPSYTPAPPMRSPRLHVSAVLLPDGKVFITGGGRYGRGEAPVFETEIYDPAANTMTPGADSSVARLYHSVAFLLPDGRVATAGGQPVYAQRGELRIEVYSPPYMFKGNRPAIASATRELNYGGQATVEITGGKKAATRIKDLRLVRPASVTHSFDAEQRVVPMTFQVSGNKLHAQVPQDRNVAPPGWYMLFAADDRGVPSVAYWVHLNP